MTSARPAITIDPEFRSLIPPLTAEERAQLEANLIADGCRDALVLWNGILLDGHNRYEICERLAIQYQLTSAQLPNRLEAKIWIVRNQFGRRNLKPFQRIELALVLEPLIRERAKENQGTRTDIRQISDGSYEAVSKETKHELAKLADVSHDTIHKAKVIAEMASEAVKERLRRGDTSIHREYEQLQKPHISYNSGDSEWYTPAKYIDAAILVLGRIDLDPASSASANHVVRASTFYSAEDNGLLKSWRGTVWMNPPYSGELIGKFCEKLIGHFSAGHVPSAIVLVNNATETAWFQSLGRAASSICFPSQRVRFWSPDKTSAQPLQGQAILYLGTDTNAFRVAFSDFGLIAEVCQ